MEGSFLEARVSRWLSALILMLSCLPGLRAQELKLQVLCSSDVHGQIMPEDPFTLQARPVGWAKLASLIRARRAANPNTLLVDCGDALQGSPSSYVHHVVKPDLPEPSIQIMNELGYHAMVVGNHEFDFGNDLLQGARKQARFPFLAGNVTSVGAGIPLFPSHIKLDLGGVKVLLVGFTTPAVPRFASSPNTMHISDFRDLVESARATIPALRAQEKPDVVVVAIHAGLGSLDSCLPGEQNPALCLAERVPGIDLILTGHTHLLVNQRHKGVPILQPGALGRALGVAEFTLRKERKGWKLVSTDTQLLQASSETPQDPKVLELTAPLRAETEKYLNTFATNLQTDLDSRWCRMEPTALTRLLHDTLRRATGAQLTAVTVPGSRIYIPKGPTSVRQFYALLPYENRGMTLRITGAQLRQYLEHAARAFNCSHMPDLFNRDFPGHEYDVVDGCSYVLDLSRPAGRRVTELRYKGEPVDDAQVFTLGVSSYRALGNGGYLDAMGYKEVQVGGDPASLRNILLERVLSKPTLELAPSNNWRIVPALDRERVLAQQP